MKNAFAMAGVGEPCVRGVESRERHSGQVAEAGLHRNSCQQDGSAVLS